MHSTGVKGIGVTNFEAAHFRLVQQIRKFDYAFILINAYRNQQYIQIFDQHTPISEPKLINNENIRELINSYQGIKACAGNGTKEIYNQIKNIEDLMILPRFPIIKAMHIANFAKKKIFNNQINNIEPLYIRPPDAIPVKNIKISRD